MNGVAGDAPPIALHAAAPSAVLAVGNVLSLRLGIRNTFRSLEVRNYRLYFFGQLVSISGTWMQTVAQD